MYFPTSTSTKAISDTTTGRKVMQCGSIQWRREKCKTESKGDLIHSKHNCHSEKAGSCLRVEFTLRRKRTEVHLCIASHELRLSSLEVRRGHRIRHVRIRIRGISREMPQESRSGQAGSETAARLCRWRVGCGIRSQRVAALHRRRDRRPFTAFQIRRSHWRRGGSNSQ